MNTNSIRLGNPTCKYCGATYSMMERHNCVFSQEAKLNAEKERADRAEEALRLSKKTLRDQMAMSCPITIAEYCSLRGFELEQDAYTLGEYCKFRYRYASAMLRAREVGSDI